MKIKQQGCVISMKKERSYSHSFIYLLIFLGVSLFLVNNISKFLSDELGLHSKTEVDVYNIYYVLNIQELLGESNEELMEKVNKTLEEKSLKDVTNGRLLSALPSLWFFSELMKESKSTNIHKYEVASFIKNLQQDNGLFSIEKAPLGKGTELRINDNLFFTKMAIDILQHYDEVIPKKSLLREVIHDELKDRLGHEKNVQLNGYLLLLLQIEEALHPQTDIIEKARKVISTQQIEDEIQKYSTDPVTVHELIEIAKILDKDVKFDADTIKEIEHSFNQLQMKNGAFSFADSNEPSILSTHDAVAVMSFLNIDIHNKEGLLDYTNHFANDSFIK